MAQEGRCEHCQHMRHGWRLVHTKGSVACMLLVAWTPRRAVSQWVADNRIRAALEASRSDPSLSGTERAALATALRVVTAMAEKVPPSDAVLTHVPITVYLKTVPSRPSFGVLHLDLNGTTTPVRELVTCIAELLQHPLSAVHLETQAGKPVLFDVHGDWTVVAVSKPCVLNVYVRPLA